MKTFVINLKSSVSRRKKIEQQLRQIGLEYEIFEAIDGRKFTSEQANSHIDPATKFSRKMSSSEIGCFLSHYHILKKIVNDNRVAIICKSTS